MLHAFCVTRARDSTARTWPTVRRLRPWLPCHPAMLSASVSPARRTNADHLSSKASISLAGAGLIITSNRERGASPTELLPLSLAAMPSLSVSNCCMTAVTSIQSGPMCKQATGVQLRAALVAGLLGCGQHPDELRSSKHCARTTATAAARFSDGCRRPLGIAHEWLHSASSASVSPLSSLLRAHPVLHAPFDARHSSASISGRRSRGARGVKCSVPGCCSASIAQLTQHAAAAWWHMRAHPKTKAVGGGPLPCGSVSCCGSASSCWASRLRRDGCSARAAPLRRVKPTLQVVVASASARSSTTVSLVKASAPQDTYVAMRKRL